MRKAIEIMLTTLSLILLVINVSYGEDEYHEKVDLVVASLNDLNVQGRAVELVMKKYAPQNKPPVSSSIRPNANGYTLPQHLSLNYKMVAPQVVSKEPYKSRYLDFGFTSIARDIGYKKLSGTVQLTAAALTSLAVHELGHVVVASEAGADGVEVDFLKSVDGRFFLGSTTYESIDSRSRLPFSMGGLVFSDLGFEYALASYRDRPTVYNKSLLFFSGLDLLRYTVLSFYLTEGHAHSDPVSVVEGTPLSEEALLTVAVVKTAMNAYRVYSGHDKIVPYFNLDKYSASFNVRIVF